MRVRLVSAWLAAISAFAVAMPTHSATAADATDMRVIVAVLLDFPAPCTSSAMPIEPVQTRTCGCTAPPNRKQKIIMKINGQDVCTATNMPCTAP